VVDFLNVGHPRIETADYASFITSRTIGSSLWFVNNQTLEEVILGNLAKYSRRYEVKLYAFAIEGSHIHGNADFPQLNRADFMRDLNASIARAVNEFVPTFPGGRLWARRYSCEYLPGPEDIEKQFFYTVLQPVKDGLVERISDYPGYNCFHDAVWGIPRTFKLIRWPEYYAAKRYSRRVRLKDYIETVELRYERLPGYEDMPQEEYALMMEKKLEEHRVEIVEERRREGKGWLGRSKLLKIIPGTRAKSPKTSSRGSFRPRILSDCPERLAEGTNWYFTIYGDYKRASELYREGDLEVVFPIGTYPPWRRCVGSRGS